MNSNKIQDIVYTIRIMRKYAGTYPSQSATNILKETHIDMSDLEYILPNYPDESERMIVVETIIRHKPFPKYDDIDSESKNLFTIMSMFPTQLNKIVTLLADFIIRIDYHTVIKLLNVTDANHCKGVMILRLFDKFDRVDEQLVSLLYSNILEYTKRKLFLDIVMLRSGLITSQLLIKIFNHETTFGHNEHHDQIIQMLSTKLHVNEKDFIDIINCSYRGNNMHKIIDILELSCPISNITFLLNVMLQLNRELKFYVIGLTLNNNIINSVNIVPILNSFDDDQAKIYVLRLFITKNIVTKYVHDIILDTIVNNNDKKIVDNALKNINCGSTSANINIDLVNVNVIKIDITHCHFWAQDRYKMMIEFNNIDEIKNMLRNMLPTKEYYGNATSNQKLISKYVSKNDITITLNFEILLVTGSELLQISATLADKYDAICYVLRMI